MNPVRAGTLRHRVVVQTVTRSSDGGGGGSLTWADTATVWASINALSGTERFEAQQRNPKLTHQVIMRYRAMNPNQRLKYGTRLFNVLEVENAEERNAVLTLLCEELVS